MKYLVIGAGGTGGCIGAYMKKAGKDVTLIARGEHLKQIKENGLRMETPNGNYTVDVPAFSMEEYSETPDVIFVCVKGYSLDDTVPFIRRIASKDTVVIPILNIYGTGGRLKEKLPDLLVTDGCIYIASQIKEPGCIWMNGTIFRIVYGVRIADEYNPILEDIKRDIDESEITGILSDNIRRDALMKFAYVSPAAACGQYYDVPAEPMQKPGEIRDTFAELVHEIDVLANAMDIHFDVDIVKTNLQILDSLAPDASTSMQRDVKAGKASEMDGLIFEVVRLAKQYNVELPMYEKIADALA